MTILFDLQDKIAIVTGASSGLGKQFARFLSGGYARLISASYRLDKLNSLATELNNLKAI